MFVQAETLIHGERLYTDLLALVRQDDALVAAMWADAESRPEELDVPGTHWTVALTEDGTPGAWCAARITDDETIKCHSNYETLPHRGRGLYEATYHARHNTVLLAYKRPAITYLYPEPVGLHLADGWAVDTTPDASGTSTPHPGGPVHHWHRLTWTPRSAR